MEYNSTRNRLIIPEYGRNIQKMIEYAVTIEDREERNRAAKAIVAVMGYLNPQLQNITDFKHKLWDHLFVISDFKLDVDCILVPGEIRHLHKVRQVLRDLFFTLTIV